MCVSVGEAQFSATTLAIWQAQHPATGRDIAVLAYQNTVKNLSHGPNAMLLHFPAKPMTPENFVDTANDRHFLKDMVDAVNPPRKTLSMGASRGIGTGVHVFEHDIYTVVLSPSAALIPDTLRLVPEDRRPALNENLFAWYGRTFPNWPIALCCFNNRRQSEAAPLTIWYEPLRKDQLMLPAIDCHTGDAPRLDRTVEVDHWVIVGSKTHFPGFSRVYYRRPAHDPFLEQVLPSFAAGKRFSGRMTNADFLIAPGSSNIGRGMLTQ